MVRFASALTVLLALSVVDASGVRGIDQQDNRDLRRSVSGSLVMLVMSLLGFGTFAHGCFPAPCIAVFQLCRSYFGTYQGSYDDTHAHGRVQQHWS